MATGSWVGPGPSTFRVVLEFRTTDQGETSAKVWYRKYVQASDESRFGGTILATSWAGNVTLYGGGPYADTDWVDLGYKSYGSKVSESASAGYTSGSTGSYYNSSTSADYYPSIPTFEPNEPTNPTATRDNDNQVTLGWTNNATVTRPYTSLAIYRAANGGEGSLLSELSTNAQSYVDQTTSADNSYTYALHVVNGAGDKWVGLGTVYMAPTAPTSISWAREQDTNVTLSLTNNSNTATALEIESRPDGSDEWTAVSTVEGVVTQTTVSLGGGQFYVRVRNTRDGLVSAWLESEKSSRLPGRTSQA